MELNHRPDGYKPSALTTELRGRYSTFGAAGGIRTHMD